MSSSSSGARGCVFDIVSRFANVSTGTVCPSLVIASVPVSPSMVAPVSSPIVAESLSNKLCLAAISELRASDMSASLRRPVMLVKSESGMVTTKRGSKQGNEFKQ